MKKLPLLLLFFFLALAVIACTGPGRGSGPEPANAGSGYDDVPRPRFSTPVTREEIREAFYRYSAVAIVKALMENNEVNWDYIVDKVASGDEDWIYDFVIYIAPGTDTSTAAGVPVALAYALQNNPKAVLYFEYSSHGPSLRRICTLPFIEPKYEFIKSYGEKTLAALQKVDDPFLLDSRDICIAHLKESIAYCDKIYTEGKWAY